MSSPNYINIEYLTNKDVIKAIISGNCLYIEVDKDIIDEDKEVLLNQQRLKDSGAVSFPCEHIAIVFVTIVFTYKDEERLFNKGLIDVS